MGLFKRRSGEELKSLRAEIGAVAARLEETERSRTGEIDALAARVQSVDTDKRQLSDEVRSLRESLNAPPPAPPEDGLPAPSAYDATQDQNVTEHLDALAAKVEGLDLRVTSIATELANQLTELSNEVGGSDEAVAAIRNGQERLANEQARYQIAFRQDLADLAERLRRPSDI